MNELIVEAKTENLQQVLDFVNERLRAWGCSNKIMAQLDIAVEELFVNISNYAYPKSSGNAVIQIVRKEHPASAEITFLDSGIPYNPLEKQKPDITLSAEERQIGGLGIYMVKKSMDNIWYEYKNGQNILTISKIL